MTGIGKRFLDAGYTTPKPLIPVDGKPMIQHVVELFPGEHNFVFICNSSHLKETNMAEILEHIAPQGRILEIPPHKLGPVYAVLQVQEVIDDEDEVIVNYCDFGKYWDFHDFLNHTRKRAADGAVSAYKGFHPHMLGPTNYAFIRDRDQWMLEIQEKKPFTDNRMNEFASDGTYYFRKGWMVKKFFQELVDRKIDLNGEYYVSMVYNLMIEHGLKVSIYEIQHMLQWGTPRDMEDYQRWSDYFSAIVRFSSFNAPIYSQINLIPLAGRGSRFIQEGYANPKPLIPVSGRPMIIQASKSLPPANDHIFVCLAEHLELYPLESEIRKEYPNALLVSVDKVTEGQACTVRLGLNDVDPDASLTIGACDNGMVWDQDKYRRLVEDTSIDAIVWSFRHHPSSERSPQMYGWLDVDLEGNVRTVSVKKPISDNPYEDHAIVGTFFFRNVALYLEAYGALIRNNIRVNNEFYVDSLIGELVKLGKRIKVFEVDHYICWGTPNDLKTFEYWQSFFHKCSWHPYSLEKDPTVASEAVAPLKERYSKHAQRHS